MERPSRRQGLSRRELLLGLGGGLIATHQAKAAERQPTNEVERRIKDRIDWVVEVMERVSWKDVEEALDKCKFLEETPIGFDHLEVTIPQIPFADPEPTDRHPSDTVHDNIQAAIGAKQVRLEKNGLTVLQTDFWEVGLGLMRVRAMYVDEYGAILIPESPPERTRRYIKQQLYLEVVSLDSSKRRLGLPKDEQRKVLEWEQEQFENPGNVFSLPPQLIEQYESQILERLEKIVVNALTERLQSIHSLPHEAAHYFFDRHLFGEDYQGPSLVDLMSLAFEQMNQRMVEAGSGVSEHQLPSWAKGIHDFFRDLPNLLDPGLVRERCEQLVVMYDFSGPKGNASVEELQAMEAQDRRFYLDRQRLQLFANEYFARIYTGAVGNTSSRVTQLQQAKLQTAGLGKYQIAESMESFLNPTPSEEAFIKSMQYKGRPLV